MSRLGEQLGLWTIAPFACMLLAIAVLPLVAEKWFHPNRNKAIVAAVLGVPTVAYLLADFGRLGLDAATHTAEEYISFIVLLFALYTISGGIYLTGNLVATPKVNLAFLGVGAVIASFIGTMGASMLLIRPLLRANSERTRSKHTVVFFIFAVSNLGGLLTPLGDPPLFMGFLRGVPFAWSLQLWPEWLVSVGLVLATYFVLDTYHYRREPERAKRWDQADYVPMRISGKINLLLFVLVIVTILASGPLSRAGEAVHFPFLREIILVALAFVSFYVGPKGPRAANHYSWAPIVEVAVVFAGIFATMIPALAILEAKGDAIGLTHPWQYYWVTGVLSSFLDNTPTYLTFAVTAQAQMGVDSIGALTSTQILPGFTCAPTDLLAAIACGAVMMGANTYIGNAPNLAVKCIAEEADCRMPSFFGYMKYSAIFLLPIFLIVTLIFLL